MNQLKENFLIAPDSIFLNHGSYGACPRPVFQEYQRWQRLLEEQPVHFFTDTVYHALKEAREALGEFVGCDEDELLFFQNPTTAISNILYNLELKNNDEILMTDHEYGALIRAWEEMGKRTGANIVQQNIPLGLINEEDFVDNFWKGVTENTKVIFISHITSPTALIFPVKKIIQRAKDKGILTIVDGAHVPGQIDLDIQELDCDFYTGALHKWLCAPKGTSYLFVKREHHGWMKPLIYSWGKQGADPGPTEFLQDFQWQGTRDMSAFLTIPKAIEFFYETIYPLRLECRQITLEAYIKFQEVIGTDPLSTGVGWLGQMVSHPLPNDIHNDIKSILLDEYKIEIPIFEWKDQKLIRISIQVYNDRKDLESLMSALESIK